jgi:hypothetical protein
MAVVVGHSAAVWEEVVPLEEVVVPLVEVLGADVPLAVVVPSVVVVVVPLEEVVVPLVEVLVADVPLEDLGSTVN